MPDLSQEALLQFFGGFAYDPVTVYTALICLMVASSFGFPVPEEVTLISVGLVAFLASNPDLYPPPQPGLTPINPITLSFVAFCAVFLSDVLVYTLGRVLGRRALRLRFVRKTMNPRTIRKIEQWSQKYGAFAAGIFRFVPGLRFPGHLMCGVTKLSFYKFAAVDGTAALLSVPTQVLLLAYYGEYILSILKQVKLVIFVVVVTAILVFIGRKIYLKRTLRKA